MSTDPRDPEGFSAEEPASAEAAPELNADSPAQSATEEPLRDPSAGDAEQVADGTACGANQELDSPAAVEAEISAEPQGVDPEDDDSASEAAEAELDESLLLAEYQSAIEGILFVSSEPVPEDQILAVFPVRKRPLAATAMSLVFDRYQHDPESPEARSTGVMLDEAGGGYRLVTRPEIHGYLRKFFDSNHSGRLSMASLETLATVAYRQPITAPEIQEVRGKNSSGVLKTLLERRLVRISGRKDVVGKPFLYSTTRDFLLHFGLASLDELPPLADFEEAFMGDGDFSGERELAGTDREEEVLQQLALVEESEDEAEPASPAPGADSDSIVEFARVVRPSRQEPDGDFPLADGIANPGEPDSGSES